MNAFWTFLGPRPCCFRWVVCVTATAGWVCPSGNVRRRYERMTQWVRRVSVETAGAVVVRVRTETVGAMAAAVALAPAANGATATVDRAGPEGRRDRRVAELAAGVEMKAAMALRAAAPPVTESGRAILAGPAVRGAVMTPGATVRRVPPVAAARREAQHVPGGPDAVTVLRAAGHPRPQGGVLAAVRVTMGLRPAERRRDGVGTSAVAATPGTGRAPRGVPMPAEARRGGRVTANVAVTSDAVELAATGQLGPGRANQVPGSERPGSVTDAKWTRDGAIDASVTVATTDRIATLGKARHGAAAQHVEAARTGRTVAGATPGGTGVGVPPATAVPVGVIVTTRHVPSPPLHRPACNVGGTSLRSRRVSTCAACRSPYERS